VDRKAEGEAREAEARRYLERAGLRFVCANARFRVGEIDLVMTDGPSLVFVEVRYRREADFGGALVSVTASKQRRLARAAASYLANQPGAQTRPCRFDVVAIGPQGVQWVRDAFQVDG